jgi:choline dehydrogenase
MLYQRGTTQSYQQWADAVDDPSFSFDAFLPYFQKSVTYTPPNTHLRAANASVPHPSSEAYQADGGPLRVTHSNWATPWASWAKKGFREIGIPDIDDFSSGGLLGAQYCPCTIRSEDQTRASSESTFLQMAMDSDCKNLKVFTHSLAKRVLFDGNKTATAVVVETGGFNYTLSASKEVIVSAGAVSPNFSGSGPVESTVLTSAQFQSPQLLMVSGIGPEETLRKHNIPVVAARPGVGQNMWDHVLVGVSYEANLPTTAVLQNQTLAAELESQYLANATGLLASQNADYLGEFVMPASTT